MRVSAVWHCSQRCRSFSAALRRTTFTTYLAKSEWRSLMHSPRSIRLQCSSSVRCIPSSFFLCTMRTHHTSSAALEEHLDRLTCPAASRSPNAWRDWRVTSTLLTSSQWLRLRLLAQQGIDLGLMTISVGLVVYTFVVTIGSTLIQYYRYRSD